MNRPLPELTPPSTRPDDSALSRRDTLKLLGGALLLPYLVACGQTLPDPSTASEVETLDAGAAFTLGWYSRIGDAAAPAQIAPRAFSELMPYIGKSSDQEISAFLDAAEAAGVRVLLELYRPLVEQGDLEGVRAFIRRYREHPAVSGWYLYDEPEVRKPDPLTPERLKLVYQAIKAEDSKPVALVFCEIDKIASYSSAMDLLMWDTYPCHTGEAELSEMRFYRDAVRRVSDIARAQGKRFINVVQAYGGHGTTLRLPSRAEFRSMVYSSLLSGVDGLYFWMLPWTTPEWAEAVLYPTVEELRPYLGAVLRGKGSPNVAPAEVSEAEVRVYPINRRRSLVMALNHSAAPLDFSVALRQPLRLTLAPYEARIVEVRR